MTPTAHSYARSACATPADVAPIHGVAGPTGLLVGPEGGWTAAEEQQAFAAGFQAVMLGPRVLRTETAALAAIAAMQVLWGDFV